MPTIRMICLANSRKRQGRCVAGLRMDGGGWVRPVSRHEHGELHPPQVTLDCGKVVAPLDIIDVELAAPHPQRHHPEDWLIGERPWRFVRPADEGDLGLINQHITESAPLLHGFGDRIPYGEPVDHSLALVRANAPRWRIEQWKERRSARVVFFHQGQPYKLGITDPALEPQLGAITTGDYALETLEGFRAGEEVLITVSLSEPFAASPNEPRHCYKLAAAILPYPPFGKRPILGAAAFSSFRPPTVIEPQM